MIWRSKICWLYRDIVVLILSVNQQLSELTVMANSESPYNVNELHSHPK